MVNLLFPDQVERLLALADAIGREETYESACRRLVKELTAILDTHVVLLERRRSAWKTIGASGDLPIDALEAAAPSLPTRVVAELSLGEQGQWTTIALRGRRPRPMLLVAVGGDWTLSQAVLEQWAAEQTPWIVRLTPRPRGLPGRRVVAVYSFARRIVRLDTRAELQRCIVRTFADAVNAEKASMAAFDPQTQSLAIVATHGYAHLLVKHLRVSTGSGFLGAAYQSKRPVVRGAAPLPSTAMGPRRLRYRTPSFIVLPIVRSDDVLGLVSVADRRDDKPFDRRDLRTLEVLSDVAALALARAGAAEDVEAAMRLAVVDSLTGLFNRRQLLIRLEEELNRARRQQSSLSALLIDVDNFKQLNDRLGHLAGDAVLRVVADVLRRSVRRFDVCARYGGDEFAVLMPGSDAENSRGVAERIREGIEDSRPSGGPWADDIRVTASLGLVTAAGGTAEQLLARADQALYAAKRAGKNCIRVSGPVEA